MVSVAEAKVCNTGSREPIWKDQVAVRTGTRPLTDGERADPITAALLQSPIATQFDPTLTQHIDVGHLSTALVDVGHLISITAGQRVAHG